MGFYRKEIIGEDYLQHARTNKLSGKLLAKLSKLSIFKKNVILLGNLIDFYLYTPVNQLDITKPASRAALKAQMAAVTQYADSKVSTSSDEPVQQLYSIINHFLERATDRKLVNNPQEAKLILKIIIDSIPSLTPDEKKAIRLVVQHEFRARLLEV